MVLFDQENRADRRLVQQKLHAQKGSKVIKNLVRHGEGWAIVIDQPILELLNIEPDTPLEVSTDGRILNVTPVESNGNSISVREASQKVNARFKKAFKKLAE